MQNQFSAMKHAHGIEIVRAVPFTMAITGNLSIVETCLATGVSVRPKNMAKHLMKNFQLHIQAHCANVKYRRVLVAQTGTDKSLA